MFRCKKPVNLNFNDQLFLTCSHFPFLNMFILIHASWNNLNFIFQFWNSISVVLTHFFYETI